ncbi:MAG: DUF1636 family protein [Cyanobacteria bacterium P01_D01_bin.115]
MAKHVLVVCEACGANAEKNASNHETGGDRLLNQLKALHKKWPRKDELAIETTTCLCICERACAVAFVGAHKPTYLFGDLDPAACAADLLTAGELYLDREDGMVSAHKLPAQLRPRRIARIPPAP